MNKTDLSTIDKEKEPSLYALCEKVNGMIDDGLVDFHVTDGRMFGDIFPKMTRDEWAKSILNFMNAPAKPITDIL